ncbi:MAG: fructosamine kinase family protein [Ancrocorticia sp.]|jgi:fructosamine-3-kinase|nr:fructosamine kinase family protein [Ancrocorticia sp.]
MESFSKSGSRPAITAEAAGLKDLAEAAVHGAGAPVVRLLNAASTTITTARLMPDSPTATAAEAFGRLLAHTHAYSPHGRVFGERPTGFTELTAAIGNAPLPVVPHGSPARTWGSFYAEDRLLPYLPTARANGSIDARGANIIERLAEQLRDGAFDAPEPALVTSEAALLHGDLWGGNILWSTPESARESAILPPDFNKAAATAHTTASHHAPGGAVAVLIDPACQGGHAESDLAQLRVFGAPYVNRIVAAYNEVSPLSNGWEERIGLHQLHMLIVHAALFGGGYGTETIEIASRYC